MYTFEQLKEDVRKEAEALRVHATPEELAKLDFGRLRPVSPSQCIYGQMTGDCYNERAAELIKECTPVFLDKIYEVSDNGVGGIGRVNVSYQEPFFKSARTDRASCNARYSAVETYILLPEANNASLISYLRGESETLTL